MRRYNGEGSEKLADKYEFIKTVEEIGYPVQKQGLVTPDQITEQRAEELKKFTDPEQTVICKPRDGKGGQGIVEMKVRDLSDFLAGIGREYIVQEKVDHQAEIRYAREIDKESESTIRIYDEKDIPKLQGDGEKTKRQLIRESQMPRSSKYATRFLNKSDLDTVVPEGGVMHVSRLGVPQKDELEWRPENRQRVQNMDTFMRHFLSDLQANIGHQMPLLCFDIGVKDMSLLDTEYKSDEAAISALRNNFIFFELQMPFTLFGYISRSRKNPDGK